MHSYRRVLKKKKKKFILYFLTDVCHVYVTSRKDLSCEPYDYEMGKNCTLKYPYREITMKPTSITRRQAI